MFTSRMYQAYRHADRTNVDYQNLLIRMASLAAEKDLTDYFEHWGLSASDETKAWLKATKLEPETKPIYYLNEQQEENVSSIRQIWQKIQYYPLN